ncbi:MAG TPA: DUF4249 family protein [Puia sp.]|nr:DUF4249 family protein [Puia sp.]
MNKKSLISLLCIGLSCIGLSACTKVIDLNVHNSAPVYVIEGNVTDQPGPYQVKISNTVGFYAGNQYPGVPGAAVTIADGAGHTDHLTDHGDGIYSTVALQGVSGQTYTLQVVIGKDTFAAVSSMPARVNLDSVVIQPVLNGGKTVLVAVPEFVNPQGPGVAYYFFDQTIDGYLDQSLYYWTSQFSAGLENNFNLERASNDSTLHVGDTVQVEMQCLDQPMYNYWSGVDQSASGSAQANPGNPTTNLTGGALGYFSAHTSQVKGARVAQR